MTIPTMRKSKKSLLTTKKQKKLKIYTSSLPRMSYTSCSRKTTKRRLSVLQERSQLSSHLLSLAKKAPLV